MRRMRSDRGFSLAELLMALLILTIVITTSMAAFLERNRRQQQAREIIIAYQALSNEAEYWRRTPYAELVGNRPHRFMVEQKDLLGGLGAPSTIVAVTGADPNVKNVLLTVRWQEGKRQARLEIIRVDPGGGGSFW
jgi:prepilin-type N-terminal cleavage/methylation domain-containing protein